MTDLARYAGSAWGGETENGALRWDRNLPARGGPARDLAKRAADDMAEMVAALEANLASRSPREAADVRESWAPLYYDLQRALRLAEASDWDIDELVAEHIATLRLAKFIATRRPAVLSLAIAEPPVRDGTSDDDFAREYMLFTHSLLPEPIAAWPDQEDARDLLERHVNLREWTIDAIQRLDRTLRLRLPKLTRSPHYARVASAQASPLALLRGLVVRPGGDTVIAEIGDPVADENEAAYLMAMSIGMRHMTEAQRGFDAGLRARGAGNRDKSLHVSGPALLAGEHQATSPIDGRIGYHPTEFARALTRDVAFPHGPSQESAAHARRSFA